MDQEHESSSFTKRRPIPVLTRENCEKWFVRMKRWLTGENLWHVIEAPIQASTDNTPISNASSSFPLSSLGFGNQQANSRALFWITACISADDEDYLMDKTTAREAWNALSSKYKEKLRTTGRQYLTEFVGYKMPPNMTVDEAWTQLGNLGRKIAATQPRLKDFATPEQRFQTLLQALPAEYAVTRDAIDAQDAPDIEMGLQKLQEKEAQLKASDNALWAGQQRRNKSHQERQTSRHGHGRRSSSNSDHSPPRRTLTCYLCGGAHRRQDCEYASVVHKAIQSAKLAKAAKKRVKLTAVNSHRNKRRNQAYDAEVVSEEELSTQESEAADESDEEIAAISKDIISKIPQSDWVADSGASSHMTDKLRLFSGPLTRMRRRTIKVGGGRLYSNYYGTVTMRDKDGNSVLLSSTLYVPKLGVNLLSGKKMCEKGLLGYFDHKGLYMRNKSGKLMLEASEEGGVYIVKHISSGLDEFALLSAMHVRSEPEIALPGACENSQVQTPGSTIDTPSEDAQMNDDTVMSHDDKAKTYRLWHRRFAHLGAAKLRDLHKVTTLSKPIPIVKDNADVCEVCALTKFVNQRGHNISERKANILALISIDICGPLPLSFTGYQYFLEIVDSHSRKIWTIPLKRRDNAPQELREWRLKVELQSGAKVLAVRSDNATELRSTLNEWCMSFGIVPQYTVPYMSIQNGVAERAIRTTENSVRAMIKEAELPIEFWAEAAQTDAYLRNRTATGPLINGKQVTPEEAFTGVKPSIDHVRVWGCKCYSYVDPKSLPEGRQDKFMDRGRVGVFMGYSEETTKQYLLWAPDLKRIIKSHAVKFAENEKGGSVDVRLHRQTPNVLPERKPVGRPRKTETAAAPLEQFPEPDMQTHESRPTSSHPVATPPEEETTGNSLSKLTAVNFDHNAPKLFSHVEIPVNKASHPDVSASTGGVKTFLRVEVPKRRREDNDTDPDEPMTKISRAMLALAAFTANDECSEHPARADIPTPLTYAEAVGDPIWGKMWKDAINAELTALAVNGTWEEAVPPREANIVTSKWVFKPKLHTDGSLDKLKARVVARGFSQMYGIDYEDTFAPTVKFDTLRVFLALVALEDLECHQVDVNNAFTESFLKETIYMAPPPGVTTTPGCVLRILRSLYGLKQAARDWHERCVTELLQLGFHQSSADPCLLIHTVKGIMLLLYVDDIIVASSGLPNVLWFKKSLGSLFKIKDLGETQKILGIRITRDRKKRTLRMDQTHYVDKVLRDLHMRSDKHRRTEIPLNGYDSLRPAGPNDQRIDQRKYQQAIGSLMYAAIHTRPDISFALGRLSQYLSDPAEHHGHALKGLLRYVRSTINLGIMYGPSGSQDLLGYSDSDYASDKLDRRSILGHVFLLGGGPVSWASRKQKSVATSTTEAEYMAMSMCAKTGVWLTQVLRDMGLGKYLGVNPHRVSIQEDETHRENTPLQLKGDNQAALTLVKDAHVHERSKHIDVAYHHIRDLHKRNQIQVDFVPSQDMIADGLTKPLPRQMFERFVCQLGLDNSGSQ